MIAFRIFERLDDVKLIGTDLKLVLLNIVVVLFTLLIICCC